MGKKRPVSKEKSTGKKRPVKAVDPNRYLSESPVWRFRRIDHLHDKWSPKNCCNFNTEIMDKLISFEGMTWGEINQQTYGKKNKSSNHFIEVNDLDKDAQNRLQHLHIHEDQVYSLRLQGEIRLFGLLNDGIYHILWFDSKHEVCKSNKRNT